MTPRGPAGRPALGAEQLEWLAETLAADRCTPTIVAMHHPPFLTGMPALDEIGLPDADRRALAAVLDRAPNLARLVAGHVHLAAFGTLGRHEVMTCPSTWRLRAVLDLGSDELRFTPGPAGLVLHVLVDGSLISHVLPL